MKYFFLAVVALVLVAVAHRIVMNNSPDRSVETGLRRDGLGPSQGSIQAQEADSIWETQREDLNAVPRQED